MAGYKNFINPYNFIPMGKLKELADKDEQKRTYTGMIEYSVLTKSPLFIPNTSNDMTFKPSYDFVPQKEGDKHKSYDFYSYHDLTDVRDDKRVPQTWEKQFFRPMIPGSEIRGMFRSNFEILTNSCMSALDTDTKLSKRTMERFSAGLLKKKGDFFELYIAKDALWRTKGENNTTDEDKWVETDPSFYTRKCYIQKDFPEGCHVSFTEERREANGRKIKSLAKGVCILEDKTSHIKGGKDGYILKGEEGPEMKQEQDKVVSQKHCCHIFYDPDLSPKGMISDAIPLNGNQLDLVLQEYEREGVHTYEEYRNQWEQFKSGENEGYFPVYYSCIKDGGEEIIFLSPACITREVYKHTLMDLAGDLKPCENGEALCPACSLFGTVMSSSAVASRIRFSDLEGEEMKDYSQCYERPITLPPLSSPKLNNMEFYMKRPPNAWFWTYDYYIDAGGNIKLQKGELSGRKFYWHNVKNLASLMEEWKYNGAADQLNITVRPVTDGYQFKGQLYFKKLTKKELDLLIYLINAGDEDELDKKKHGYKLGAAKPLGFGSIACHVDSVKLISYQRKENTVKRQEMEYDLQMKSDLVKYEIKENFEKMTKFATLSEKELISYPRSDDNGNNSLENNKGYQWFVDNHIKRDGNRGVPGKRTDMRYKEYMEPMEPKLKKTGAGAPPSPKSQSNGKKPYKQNKKMH